MERRKFIKQVSMGTAGIAINGLFGFANEDRQKQQPIKSMTI